MANEGRTYSELEHVAQTHLDEAGVGKADTLGERVLMLVNWRNSLRYSAEAISKDSDRLSAELARVRGLLQREWMPIDSAPKTGEHILVAVFDSGIGFGTCGGKKQAWAGVVHYWEHDEPGWYMSTANGDIRVAPTHWQEISELDSANFRRSSSLVPQGAESADIGKLDTADEKPSAETGGEKATPNFWKWYGMLSLLYHRAGITTWGSLGMATEQECHQVIGEFERFCKQLPTFPRRSQNQTVSGGVDGSHEGTTADEKWESREPEKLNNAQKECPFCGSIEGKEHHEECDYRKAQVALAESSLSSPPPDCEVS